MDRIEKALKKLSEKERKKLKEILAAIILGDTIHMNVQKLRGHHDIYRVRKGNLRVIYRIDKDGVAIILTVERRSDTTYSRL